MLLPIDLCWCFSSKSSATKFIQYSDAVIKATNFDFLIWVIVVLWLVIAEPRYVNNTMQSLNQRGSHRQVSFGRGIKRASILGLSGFTIGVGYITSSSDWMCLDAESTTTGTSTSSGSIPSSWSASWSPECSSRSENQNYYVNSFQYLFFQDFEAFW